MAAGPEELPLTPLFRSVRVLWLGGAVDEVSTRYRERRGHSTEVMLDDQARRCCIIDWANRDDGLDEMLSDMFGDGSPEGFAMRDDDQLVPFAIVGMTQLGDPDGQPEGVLFIDTANGSVVSVDVDGTAIVETLQVVAPSLGDLSLRAA